MMICLAMHGPGRTRVRIGGQHDDVMEMLVMEMTLRDVRCDQRLTT